MSAEVAEELRDRLRFAIYDTPDDGSVWSDLAERCADVALAEVRQFVADNFIEAVEAASADGLYTLDRRIRAALEALALTNEEAP